jgi:hypothetical protein
MVHICDVIVRLRPVYPISVRIPNFFKSATPNFAKHVYLLSGAPAIPQSNLGSS